MNVTGFQMTNRLRELQDLREIVAAQFNECLFRFQGEQKPSPEELTRTFEECERKIALLQVAQARYNLSVTVEVLGQAMTLHQAVKRVGGAARLAKLWKDAAKRTNTAAYGYGPMAREKDNEYAERTVSVESCLAHSTQASRVASALRQAIQLGNSVAVDIDGLDPELFA